MMGNICDIKYKVETVRENIEKAAIKSGRKADEITLVGVTKTQSAAVVKEVLNAGITTIGENRVQEILEKAPELEGFSYETHLIGNLQRNKAKFLPNKISMIQTIDNVKIIEVLEKIFAAENLTIDALIEVNIGDETNKNGVTPNELPALVQRIKTSPILHLRGLMAIPPFVQGEKIRRYFQKMYRLFVDIKEEKTDNNTVNILSMGMSSDYEDAILEGATMVRVGSYLFGTRI